jgi:DNA-binding NtrC family response regulator
MVFESPNINTDKSPEESIKQLKAYLEDLTDRLNMFSLEVDKLKEREGK